MSLEKDRNGTNTQIELPDKIDYLFEIIKRFDFYTNSTNAKASLIIAWNGVLIGTVLLKYSEILSIFQTVYWAKITVIFFLLLIGISGAISNLFIFWGVFPFLRKSSKAPTGKILESESAIFFGSVAQLDAKTYHDKILNSDATDLLTDLTDQAATIAQGLNNKMKLIRISLSIIGIQFIFIIGLLILATVVNI